MSQIRLSHHREENTTLLGSDFDNYYLIKDHEDVDYTKIKRVYRKKDGSLWRRVTRHEEEWKDKYKFIPIHGNHYRGDNTSRLLCKVPILEVLGEDEIDLTGNTFSYYLKNVDLDSAGFIWVKLRVKKYRGGKENTTFTKKYALDASLRVLYAERRNANNEIPFGSRKECAKFLRKLYYMYPNKRKVKNFAASSNYKQDFEYTKKFVEYNPNDEELSFLDFQDKNTRELIEEVNEHDNYKEKENEEITIEPVGELFDFADNINPDTHILELYCGTAHYHNLIDTLFLCGEEFKSGKMLSRNGKHLLKYGVKRLLEVNMRVGYVAHFYISTDGKKQFMGGTPHILP